MFDTCVIVAAVRSRGGASNALVQIAIDELLTPVLIDALFYEYEEVLSRPENLARNRTRKDIEEFLDSFAAVSEPATSV